MKPRLSYQQDTRHHRQAITATSDIQELIFFADVVIRKITKKKYKQPFLVKTAKKSPAERVEKIKARAFGLPW